MKFRRVQSWVWWLLPLLVARAVLPVGFMAQAHQGRFEVVLCSVAALSTSEDGGHSTPASNSHENCPFAHAAAAPLPTLHILPKFAALAGDISLPDISSPITAGPIRFDRARGPPALS